VHLVQRLLARGHDVTMFDVERNASAAKIEGAGACFVVGSAADADLADKAVVGHEMVFHLAAAFRQSADFYRHAKSTAPGTSWPRRSGIPSERSFIAARPALHGGARNEDTPIGPDDLYHQTKWGGEQVCQEFIERGLTSPSCARCLP
jgi:nucleoside-diphosphate-sugar epimerase